MAEDALKDEHEWTVDDEPDDLGELVIILEEVDITSKTRDVEREKEKITEKTVPKTKLSPKQQQLQNAAKNSKKITEFFSKKRQPPVVRTALREDAMMDLEDNMMEWECLPSLSWTEILRMESN